MARNREERTISTWIRGSLVVLAIAATAMQGRLSAQASYTLLTGGSANIDAGSFLCCGLNVSADGSKLFFQTTESLSPLDTDTASDIYLASGGQITLISGGTANIGVTLRRISLDGSKAFFVTTESLDPADIDVAQDVYEWSAGTLKLLTGGVLNKDADVGFFWNYNGVSDDGSKVYFVTDESLSPADVDSVADIYLASGGTITLITPGSGAHSVTYRGATRDGSAVHFFTSESLVAADVDGNSDLYQAWNGQVFLITPGVVINGQNSEDHIYPSADGSRVAFDTLERIRPGAGEDEDNRYDCYLWSRSTGQTTLVSGPSLWPAADPYDQTCEGITDDGSRVYIAGSQNLSPSDTNQNTDVYEWSGGSLTLLTSAASGLFSTVQHLPGGLNPPLDGSKLLILSNDRYSSGDTDSLPDQYLRSGGTYTLLSRGTTQFYIVSGISLDMTRMYIVTTQALDAADTDAAYDVYEGSGGNIRLLSPNTTQDAFFMGASADGTRVLITTNEALNPADHDTAADVYEVSLAPSDTEPPVVTVSVDPADAPAASNWYNLASSGSNGVLVHVSAADAGTVTNVTATDGASTVLNTPNASGSFALGDGQHTIAAVATDDSGNTGAGSGSTAMPILIRVDQTPPIVTCTNPTVLLKASGSIVIATVSDATSGPVSNVSIVPSAATVGAKTAPATGSDNAGNQATQTCGYQVVYQFTGFGAPVLSPPNQYVTAAVFKNIPLTFSLSDAQNAPILNLNFKVVIESDVLNGALCSGGQTKTLAASDYPKGKSGLIEIGGGNYEYRWKAPKSEAGQCRRFGLDFGDGVIHSVGFLLTP